MNLVKIENAGQGTYAEFKIPVGAKLLVKTGDHVEAGDPLMVVAFIRKTPCAQRASKAYRNR